MPEMPPTPVDLPGAAGAAPDAEPEAATEHQIALTRAEQAERQRDEYLSLLRQAQADYENAHQRHRREREQEHKFRAEGLARDLLPAVDNLERALSSVQDADDHPLVHGVKLVRDQLLDALKRHGIAPLDALGKPFDPNYHQALMQIPTPDKPGNCVVQVVEQGYLHHERVLRVAKVIISQPNQ